MKILTLKRIASVDNGTFGVLLDEQFPFAVVGERVWLNNKPDESCIPKSKDGYTIKRVTSPKFGETFQVMDVVGRDGILFHKGNIPSVDSHGCLLVGENFGLLNGLTAVLASGDGFSEFMNRMAGANEGKLIIVEC